MDETHPEMLKAWDTVELYWLTCLYSDAWKSGGVERCTPNIGGSHDSASVYSRVLERRFQPSHLHTIGRLPPPLQEFIKKNSNSSTRAATRGNCTVPFRKSASGQAVFSSRACNTWNVIPSAIRELSTLSSFTKHLVNGQSKLLPQF